MGGNEIILFYGVLRNTYIMAEEHQKTKCLVQLMLCFLYAQSQLTLFMYLQSSNPAQTHNRSLRTQHHLAILLSDSIFFHIWGKGDISVLLLSSSLLLLIISYPQLSQIYRWMDQENPKNPPRLLSAA